VPDVAAVFAPVKSPLLVRETVALVGYAKIAVYDRAAVKV